MSGISLPASQWHWRMATSARIKVSSTLISDLTTGSTTTKLSSWLKSAIRIATNYTIVTDSVGNVLQSGSRTFLRIVFNKAKSTRGFGNHIQTHNYSLHRTNNRESFQYLCLGGKK